MYAVTSTFKDKIKENNRVFAIEIVINHSGGTLVLTDADIVEGSVLYTQKSQNGDDFTCGGVVSNTLDFGIIRKPEYNTIDFVGAKVTAQIALLLVEGYDEYVTFLNPNTPSFYPEMADQFEWVPLGSFNVDIVTKLTTTMELKCVDNMINLDESYSQSTLSYPATLEQIYLEICTFGDVTPITLSFPNDGYIVPTKPTGDYSYRDLLAWVAELSGTFAHINRTNGLELKWYGTSSVESYNGNHRFDYKVKEHTVQITGVSYSTEDTTYITGTDDYVLDLSNNLLLQDNYETVLPNILSNVDDLIFNPFESNWQGNPALDVGDLVTHTALDTNIYVQPLTTLKYKYRGKSYMAGEGKSISEHNYKGSTDKRLEIIKKQIEDSVGNQITDLEQAIIDATDLITTELGGYVLKRENELLIMDNPDPDLAVKVWRWNLGGLGYSTTGVNGTYGTAITMNGQIVANYITTGTLSADRVRAGSIVSESADITIDLSNNSFNFKNQLIWNGVNNRVEIGSGTLLTAPVIEAGTITGSLFRTALSGKRLELNSDGLKSYNASGNLDGVQITSLGDFGEIEFYSGLDAYSSVVTYYNGDVVSYNNGGYKCIVDGTLNILPTNTSNWVNVIPVGQPLSIKQGLIGTLDERGIPFALFSDTRDVNIITRNSRNMIRLISDYAISLDSYGLRGITLDAHNYGIDLEAGTTVEINANDGIYIEPMISSGYGDIRLTVFENWDNNNRYGMLIRDNFQISAGTTYGDNYDLRLYATDRMYLKSWDTMLIESGTGDIEIWGYNILFRGSVIHSSDISLKNNICELDDRLFSAIDKTPILSFSWREKDNRINIGSIAQYLKKSLIENGLNPDDYNIWNYKVDDNGEELQYINYIEFALLKIASLERKIKKLEEEVGI